MVYQVGVIPSVVPAVIDRLIALFPDRLAAQGIECRVLDAVDDTDDPSDALIIGAGDPDVEGYQEAADTTGDWANTGGQMEREEIGDITCSVVAAGGSDDMKVVRDRAYAVLAQVTAALYLNPQLKADVDDPADPGVDGLEWVTFGSSTRPIQGLDLSGNRVVIVLFRIHFQARI